MFLFSQIHSHYFYLIIGLAALITFFVHLWQLKNKWDGKLSSLHLLMLTGCFIQLAGVVSFAVYLALAIQNNQGKYIHFSEIYQG